MTDLDLERLGDVWRQRPDPGEMAELQRAAETARRRGRWAQWVDTIAAVVVSGVVALLVLRNPQVDTLLIGGGAIALLLISQLRQRKLRAKELRSLTGSSEEMLDQSIERVTATLKRSHLGLIMAGPAILTGLLFAFAVEQNSGGELAARVAAYPGLRTIIAIAAGLGFGGMALQAIRQFRRSRRELERLTSLREAYRQESESNNGE